MKIAGATVAMQSQHALAVRQERKETSRSWVGQQRLDFAGSRSGGRAAPSVPAVPPAQISTAGQASQASAADAVQAANDAVDNDPILKLIKTMLEWMTGQPVKMFYPAQFQASSSYASSAQSTATAIQAAPPPARAGYGVEYDYHAVREETEQTTFAAQGTVQTSDGKAIDFKLDLSMARSYREETNISVRAGDAVRKDPLVINFDGAAAQLSNQHFRFDLTDNGKAVDVPLLGSGSGYLALDLNHNGKIDSGAELFGPASGAGFAELAKHDQDGNGWIDENDAIFKQLRVWTPAADGGGALSTLKERNVGALYLGHTGTAFELRGSGNQDLGAVRESGVYLTESGQSGSLQEIDLTV